MHASHAKMRFSMAVPFSYPILIRRSAHENS
jgi:hypothetical protein